MERNLLLVIDDDEDFRDLVALVVGAMGLKMLSAPDCRVGIELLRREPERVLFVLMDYSVPGLEPGSCARGMEEVLGLGVPIVLCTAAVSAAQRAADLRLTRWLGKPFDLETLRRLVREMQALWASTPETIQVPESQRPPLD